MGRRGNGDEKKIICGIGIILGVVVIFFAGIFLGSCRPENAAQTANEGKNETDNDIKTLKLSEKETDYFEQIYEKYRFEDKVLMDAKFVRPYLKGIFDGDALNKVNSFYESKMEEWQRKCFDEVQFWQDEETKKHKGVPEDNILLFSNYDNRFYQILYIDERIVSIVENMESYSGGAAHSQHGKRSDNFFRATGEKVLWTDLFSTQESQEFFVDLIYRNLMEIPEKELLFTTVEEELKNKIRIYLDEEQNFYLSENGVTVVFDTYSIAPAAAEIIEISAGFEELGDYWNREAGKREGNSTLLRRETVYVNDEWVQYYTYLYDGRGRVIREKEYGRNSEEEKFAQISEREYFYTEQGGYMVSITFPDNENYELEEYDREERLVKSSFSYDGKESSAVYEYMTEDGYAVMECLDDGGKLIFTSKEKLDEYGNSVEYIQLDENGRISSEWKCSYEYDADGNMLKEIRNFSDGARDLCQYEYDKNGNLSRKIRSQADGEKKSVRETIVYSYDEKNRLCETYTKYEDHDQRVICEYME